MCSVTWPAPANRRTANRQRPTKNEKLTYMSVHRLDNRQSNMVIISRVANEEVGHVKARENGLQNDMLIGKRAAQCPVANAPLAARFCSLFAGAMRRCKQSSSETLSKLERYHLIQCFCLRQAHLLQMVKNTKFVYIHLYFVTVVSSRRHLVEMKFSKSLDCLELSDLALSFRGARPNSRGEFQETL